MTRHNKGPCGNCSYDCCCRCDTANCYLCRKIGKYRKCTYTTYAKHFICFKCNYSWKRYNISLDEERQACPHCNMPPKVVPSSIRIPKKHDNKSWVKLEKFCHVCPVSPATGYCCSVE